MMDDDEKKMLIRRATCALDKRNWLLYELRKTEVRSRKKTLEVAMANFDRYLEALSKNYTPSKEDRQMLDQLGFPIDSLPDLYVALYLSDEIESLFENRDPDVCLKFSRDKSVSASYVSPCVESKLLPGDADGWVRCSWRLKIPKVVESVVISGGLKSRRSIGTVSASSSLTQQRTVSHSEAFCMVP